MGRTNWSLYCYLLVLIIKKPACSGFFYLIRTIYLIATFLTFDFTCLALGISIAKTPSFIEAWILPFTTSSGKLNIDSNYQTFEVHSGVTKTNSKLIPNVGLTGSFSITPSYDESKYYSWRNRKVGNVSVFFSDKYNLINNDNNNFNLGWLLDFRNSVGDKSQVYSINGTSATYKQDNALTREISLVANLGYEKKITDNGKFTAGISAKNTNQDVKSLSGNLGFKLKF